MKKNIPIKNKKNCFSKTIDSLYEVEFFLNTITQISKICKIRRFFKH